MDKNIKTKIIYKEKNSIAKTVTIVILSILLVIMMGYIFYLNFFNVSKEEVVEQEFIREEMYYSEVEQLLSQIDGYNQFFKNNYPIDDFNKVDNQLKLQFGIYTLKKDKKIYNYYEINDMKEIYKKYFIDNFKVIYEDITCPAKDKNLYDLNNETKKYIEVGNHEHGVASMNTSTYFVSSKIEDDKYVISTHILYSNYCNGICNPEGGYYKSYDDCVNGENVVTYRINEYDKVKNKLPVTVFTFVKDADYFKLESVKIN